MSFTKTLRCACDAVMLTETSFIWDEDGVIHGRMGCVKGVPG